MYVGVSSSFLIFLITQIIARTSSHIVGRSYRSRSRLPSTAIFLCSSLLYFRHLPHLGKESSLFVPSFLFFSSPHPCGTLPTPVGGNNYFIGVSSRFFERLKHFLFVSIFLYLYYSRKKSFVKGFLKKNLKK